MLLEHLDKYDSKKCISFEALEFCKQHGIELLCIPPHTSHLLKPPDTHLFKEVKSKWSTLCSLYLKVIK